MGSSPVVRLAIACRTVPLAIVDGAFAIASRAFRIAMVASRRRLSRGCLCVPCGRLSWFQPSPSVHLAAASHYYYIVVSLPPRSRCHRPCCLASHKPCCVPRCLPDGARDATSAGPNCSRQAPSNAHGPIGGRQYLLVPHAGAVRYAYWAVEGGQRLVGGGVHHGRRVGGAPSKAAIEGGGDFARRRSNALRHRRARDGDAVVESSRMALLSPDGAHILFVYARMRFR